jgi:hypothetical protein
LRRSCSSGTDVFCEIFDYDQRKITVDELVENYYSLSKNSQKGTSSEEQEKEQESSPAEQTDPDSSHSTQKTEKKEQGISNVIKENSLIAYLCYYCEDCNTAIKENYEDHVVLKHPGKPAYPNKAEIEKLELKPQGKDWEI